MTSSIVLLTMLGMLSYVISIKKSRAYTSISDILSYQSALNEDAFQRIPFFSFSGCDALILDEDYEVLFSTSSSISEALTKEQVELINDYEQDTFYWVSQYRYKGQLDCTIICQYQENEEINEILDFCILDPSNQVVAGGLFPEKTKLTSLDLELLGGVYNGHRNVERYSYQNAAGNDRTLILFSDFFSYKTYEAQEKAATRLWLFAIPIILSITAVFSLLLLNRIKKSLKPLEEAILSYGEGRRMEVDERSVPSEIGQVVVNFDRMLDQIETSRAEADKASKEKNRILADISHDIKTPLTVIQCYSKALADHLATGDKKEEYIQVIYHRSETMADIVTSLVDYTRMEHPDFFLDLQRRDFCEFCRVYFSERYQELDLAGFRLDIDIPEEMIDCNFDPKLMRRVLENLTNNAIKYNSKGTTLHIQVEDDSENIHLRFGDDGIGISDTLRDSIFQPFVSGNHARTAGSGSGLGLYIVKRIVELHGGTIRLETKKMGLSTLFQITLPKRLSVSK